MLCVLLLLPYAIEKGESFVSNYDDLTAFAYIRKGASLFSQLFALYFAWGAWASLVASGALSARRRRVRAAWRLRALGRKRDEARGDCASARRLTLDVSASRRARRSRACSSSRPSRAP